MTRISRTVKSLGAILVVALLPAFPAFAADLTAAASQAFLASHAHTPGVIVRPSGLQYRVLKNGFGRHAASGDTVQLNYTARLVNGAVVDGTSPGLPVSIGIGNTIAGLSEALLLMREGDHWELTLPPALAFGAKGGAGGIVPPDQAVIFDVTLLTATAPGVVAPGSRDGLSINANAREGGAYWTIHP